MNRFHRLVAGSALAVALTGGGVSYVLAQNEAAGKPQPRRAQQGDQQDQAPRHRGDWRPGQDGQPGPESGMRGGPMGLLRGIELTDEQRDQVKQIFKDTREQRDTWRTEHSDEIKAAQDEVEQARKALYEAEKKMRDLMQSAPGNPKEIGEKIKSVLTDEQQAQFEKNLEQIKEQGPPPMMGRPGMRDGERPRMMNGEDGQHPRRNRDAGPPSQDDQGTTPPPPTDE